MEGFGTNLIFGCEMGMGIPVSISRIYLQRILGEDSSILGTERNVWRSFGVTNRIWLQKIYPAFI